MIIKDERVAILSDMHIGKHQDSAKWHEITLEFARETRDKLNRDKIRCRLDEEEWHDYWRYARGEIKTVCCSGPLEFYSEHAQEFISWVINAGNEAQKYASYARAHCPSLLVKMLYDHVFSIEALEVIRDSWAGRAFYISKTEGFDWSYVKEQRQLAMTGSCDCPV